MDNVLTEPLESYVKTQGDYQFIEPPARRVCARCFKDLFSYIDPQARVVKTQKCDCTQPSPGPQPEERRSSGQVIG